MVSLGSTYCVHCLLLIFVMSRSNLCSQASFFAQLYSFHLYCSFILFLVPFCCCSCHYDVTTYHILYFRLKFYSTLCNIIISSWYFQTHTHWELRDLNNKCFIFHSCKDVYYSFVFIESSLVAAKSWDSGSKNYCRFMSHRIFISFFSVQTE